MEYDFKDLKSNLVKGKVTQTFTSLLSIARDELKDKKLEKEITVLQYRWENLQREERQNTISYEQASITKNQITSAVLELLDKIQHQIETGSTSREQKKSSIIKYLAGVGLLAIAGVVAYFNFFNKKPVIKASNIYMDCPFVDTIPFNVLIFPFEGKRIEEDSREAEEALRRGLSDRTSMNELNTVVRIHNESMVIDDFDDAREKLKECKANLIIWGSIYEEEDSTKLNIKYVADNLTSDITDLSRNRFEETIKSISSLESGELLSRFDELLSISVPLITGLNLVKANKLDEAIEEFKKVRSTEGNVNKLVSKNLGDVHLLKEDYDKAIESYNSAIDPKEDDATTYNNIGFALYKKGDIEGALENFKKAGQINPGNNDIQNNIQGLEEEFSKLNPASVVISNDKPEKITEQEPLPPVVVPDDDKPNICNSYIDCFNNGESMINQQKIDEAIEFFKAAIEYDNSQAKPYHNLGSLYLSKQNYDLAETYYLRAISADPKFPNPHYKLYEIYTFQGKEDKANKAYETFQSLGGQLIK